jgi:hypothetical protein
MTATLVRGAAAWAGLVLLVAVLLVTGLPAPTRAGLVLGYAGVVLGARPRDLFTSWRR